MENLVDKAKRVEFEANQKAYELEELLSQLDKIDTLQATEIHIEVWEKYLEFITNAIIQTKTLLS